MNPFALRRVFLVLPNSYKYWFTPVLANRLLKLQKFPEPVPELF